MPGRRAKMLTWFCHLAVIGLSAGLGCPQQARDANVPAGKLRDAASGRDNYYSSRRARRAGHR